MMILPVLVVFHRDCDDMPANGALNALLRERDLLPGPESPVLISDLRDSRLVTCLDGDPKTYGVTEKLWKIEPTPQFAILHETSLYEQSQFDQLFTSAGPLAHCTIRKYHHERGDPIYAGLLDLLGGAPFSSFMVHFAKSASLPDVASFTVIKHHIAHLFLPLDIDLQELRTSRSEGQARLVQSAYLDGARPRPILQLLADLQFLVAGVARLPCADGSSVEASLAGRARQPEAATHLWALFNAREMAELDVEAQALWKQVWGLTGLGSARASDLNSEVFRLLNGIDTALSSPEALLGWIEEDLDSEPGRLHQWLVELDFALDRLRSKLIELSEEWVGGPEA